MNNSFKRDASISHTFMPRSSEPGHGFYRQFLVLVAAFGRFKHGSTLAYVRPPLNSKTENLAIENESDESPRTAFNMDFISVTVLPAKI